MLEQVNTSLEAWSGHSSSPNSSRASPHTWATQVTSSGPFIPVLLPQCTRESWCLLKYHCRYYLPLVLYLVITSHLVIVIQ
jgi:hypothetical protein